MRPGIGITDVDAIVATSHRRNPLLGITGLLTFGSEIFFQWIEGPKLEVLDLIKLIETDNRHENMVILSSDEEVRERIFPNWDMELVSANDIKEVLNDALRTARERSSIDALKLLLAKVERH